jgi:recombinational DNA repair protein RecR
MTEKFIAYLKVERHYALNTQLCIVETPSDIHAIEQSSAYKGKYFVLSLNHN